MTELSLEDAIRRKKPELLLPKYRDAAVIGERCPTCGSGIACIYNDLGTTGYYDHYAHLCLNPECGFLLHEEHWSPDEAVSARPTVIRYSCPWCDRRLRVAH